MISLIVLPVLLIPFAVSVTANGNLRLLEITVAEEAPVPLNYIEIHLTGNKQDDLVRLNFGKVEAREIIESRDTLRGVRFVFGASAKYESLVGIISDINRIDSAKYNFGVSQVSVYYSKPVTIIDNNVRCGTSSMYVPYRCTPELTVMNSVPINRLMVIITGFVVLVVCSCMTLSKFSHQPRRSISYLP